MSRKKLVTSWRQLYIRKRRAFRFLINLMVIITVAIISIWRTYYTSITIEDKEEIDKVIECTFSYPSRLFADYPSRLLADPEGNAEIIVKELGRSEIIDLEVIVQGESITIGENRRASSNILKIGSLKRGQIIRRKIYMFVRQESAAPTERFQVEIGAKEGAKRRLVGKGSVDVPYFPPQSLVTLFSITTGAIMAALAALSLLKNLWSVLKVEK